jgi:hypothetical protein
MKTLPHSDTSFYSPVPASCVARIICKQNYIPCHSLVGRKTKSLSNPSGNRTAVIQLVTQYYLNCHA